MSTVGQTDTSFTTRRTTTMPKVRTTTEHGKDSARGIEYGLSGLGELLRGFRLRVPKYQRSYAWDDEHVIDLLDDPAGAIEKGDSRHFVGSIVLTRLSNEDLEIVDGQ